MALPGLGALRAEADALGTPGWRPMLAYVARSWPPAISRR